MIDIERGEISWNIISDDDIEWSIFDGLIIDLDMDLMITFAFQT